jgi:cytochrome P450
LQGRIFFDRRRERYGNVFKTHILGKPTVRIIGATNARKILLNENSLVESQWPRSIQMLLGEGSLTLAAGKVHTIRKRAILRAFTYDALSGYAVTTQTTIQKYIKKWCCQRHILGYNEFRSLAFELSCRVLLGFEMSKEEHGRLLSAFETFMSSLFSIPMRIPGLGLDKVRSMI